MSALATAQILWRKGGKHSPFARYLLPWSLVLLALGLRLLVWRWHEQYPLGGDEQEYLTQALTLLRERRYVELKLMRPPLYTGFLAVCIYLFDSLVQRLRLIQALLSALTVVPVYALTYELFRSQRIAGLAALLAALSYTLAANATELLTETLFLFGLTTFFWLLLRAGRDYRPERASLRSGGPLRWPLLAGLALGGLLLVRSVALPLLVLGALWLLLRPLADPHPMARKWAGMSWRPAAAFVLACALVVVPWTIRNYLSYGAPILIDTTGPENLWLDNDPSGREAVKRQLYALGEDRAARQQLAMERGLAAIAADPTRFLAKVWGEAQRFFALEYFDYMREHREIWVPRLEVWLRLLLGDGLWLLLLLTATAGLILHAIPSGAYKRPLSDRLIAAARHPTWIFILWALYVLLTALVFHVELRYRLPLYPALLPFAAWTLALLWQPSKLAGERTGAARAAFSPVRLGAVALVCLALIGLTLLHRPYLGETWALAWKHMAFWQAQRALERDDTAGAHAAARRALDYDPDSALAQVVQARAFLEAHDQPAALAALDVAQQTLSAHPYARLLRGAILRQQGRGVEARPELAYERASLEDLQGWAWQVFAPVAPPPPAVEVGGGLDLGFVRGFSHAEQGAFRWSGAASDVMLNPPADARQLDLRLASGRPPGVPAPTVVVLAGHQELGRIQPGQGWRTYSLPLPQRSAPLVLTIRSDTFRPRDYDRASPDGRTLGVMVARVAAAAP